MQDPSYQEITEKKVELAAPKTPLEAQTTDLATSNALLKTIFDTVPLRIFWKDKSMRYLGCNAAFARDAGLANSNDVVGQDDTQMPWHELAAQYHRDDHRVISEQVAVLQYEEPQTTADGRTIWLRTSKMPLHAANGAVTGILGVYDDITELVQARALIQLRTTMMEIIVQSQRSLGELLEDMIRAVEAVVPDLIGSVLLLDPDGRHLRHGAAPSLPKGFIDAIDGSEIGPCAGSCGTAAYRGQEVIVSDIASDPLWRDHKALALSNGLAACYSDPIVDARGKVLGTFAMYWPHPRAAMDSDLNAIRMMAKVACIAIERQQADQALRKSEQRYQDLYDNAPDMFVSVDSATARILHCNQTLASKLGYSKEEMVGKPVVALYHPDSKAAAQSAFALFAKQGELHDVQLQLQRKDGTPIDVSLNTTAVRDAQGQVLYSRSIWRDITEQKRATEQARATQQLLNEAFERVTDAFVALDDQWRYTYVNARAGEIFNRKPEDLIGKRIWTEFPEGIGQPFQRAYEQALAEQKPVRFEEYFATYDRWFLNLVYPSPHGLSVYFHDVTAQKKAELALQKHQQQLEQTVTERTAELSERIEQMRRFALLTADRELRIQELRHENQRLKQQLGNAGAGAGAPS